MHQLAFLRIHLQLDFFFFLIFFYDFLLLRYDFIFSSLSIAAHVLCTAIHCVKRPVFVWI